MKISESIDSVRAIMSGSEITPAQLATLKHSGSLCGPDARIDNGVIDPVTADYMPGESSSWYVAADGASHTVEIQYLSGTRNTSGRFDGIDA